MNEMVFLRRESTWLKTLFHEGKEIQGFVFYNEDGVVLEINRGWFDNENEYPKAVKEITLSQVRRARVVKMENKDNFIIKGVMYIYCGKGGDFELKGVTKRQQEFDTTIHHYNRFTFNCHNDEVITIEEVSHVETTSKGERVKEVCRKLEEMGISIPQYEVKKLIENNLLNI